ncbi:MAG: right-handed parallel beta-helix repeat-containing protein [Dehalococcoidales bacterium]|nr:right-handed parallel beta-helix repeat-containing protein [Dehalococcoidales bacterium]
MKKRFSKILGVGLTVALLASLLLTVMPVSALTQPSVTFPTTADAVISKVDATYNVRFQLAKELGNADTITITFPSDTTISATPTVSILASPGWIGGAWLPANLVGGGANAPDWVGNNTTKTITGTLDDALHAIGEGAEVRISITAGITNPTAPAAYTLTVKTTEEATAVASAAYTINPPSVGGLPGIVTVYNPSGILMSQKTGGTAIEDAIADAATTGYVIKIGPGTYTEAAMDTDVDGVTLVATGTAAETILKGAFTIDNASCTLEGVTIQGTLTIATTGNKATVKNCVINKASSTTGATLVTYSNTVASGTGTISGCTIDTTSGAVVDTGILVNQTGLTISGCTISVDAGDKGVDIVSGTTKITGGSITGNSGTGISAAAGATTITTALSNLTTAIDVTAVAATVTIDGSTITNCGTATTPVKPAVNITAAAAVTIKNSTITGSPDQLLTIADGADVTYVMFNDLSGNTKGIDNNDAGVSLNATHNWWGAATGPATAFNSADVNATGYLGAAATGTFALNNNTLNTATTQKVDVSIVTTAGAVSNAAIIGVANYATNPQAATSSPALANGFFDVYIGTPANTSDVATIKLYNANITADSVAYVWSELQGGWAKCSSQGVNTFSGYVWIKTGTTATPAISDLTGTPFVLVKGTATITTLTAPAIVAPVAGEKDVFLKPTFAWAPVTGASAYYFELADNPNFVVPIMRLSGDLGRLIVTYYAHMTDLDYSSAYYWRVKAVSGSEDAGNLIESPWNGGVFITEQEPVEPEPPVVVEEVQPPVITVEIPAETQITPSWIYVIIGVGAVLVIAVIVLIVRTRRVS